MIKRLPIIPILILTTLLACTDRQNDPPATEENSNDLAAQDSSPPDATQLTPLPDLAGKSAILADPNGGSAKELCDDGSFIETSTYASIDGPTESICGQIVRGRWGVNPAGELVIVKTAECKNGSDTPDVCRPVDCKPVTDATPSRLADADQLRTLQKGGSIDKGVGYRLELQAGAPLCKSTGELPFLSIKKVMNPSKTIYYEIFSPDGASCECDGPGFLREPARNCYFEFHNAGDGSLLATLRDQQENCRGLPWYNSRGWRNDRELLIADYYPGAAESQVSFAGFDFASGETKVFYYWTESPSWFPPKALWMVSFEGKRFYFEAKDKDRLDIHEITGERYAIFGENADDETAPVGVSKVASFALPTQDRPRIVLDPAGILFQVGEKKFRFDSMVNEVRAYP